MKIQFTILVSILLLAGCAQNRVTTIHATPPVIVYENDSKNRFGNLYAGEKEYPVTCEGNCYPASEIVSCKTAAENCIFNGINTLPNLNFGVNVQWLGHASFKLKFDDGTQLLIDPVSKQFDWPVDWAFRLTAGYYRKEPDWPALESMRSSDAVLYSHIHYDHFNKADIGRIGNSPQYLTPLGFADHFESSDFNITEMSWYGKTKINNLDIHFVPAHHFSSRIWVPYIYNDDDETLWGGWVIEYKSGEHKNREHENENGEHQGKKIFFAGDTGYSKHFSDIRDKLGPMDVCLLPIASYYHPEHAKWYRYVHTTPEDALIAAKELECKITIPWGYGNNSWKMGDRSSHSPLLRLLKMHKEMESGAQLHILNEGESVDL